LREAPAWKDGVRFVYYTTSKQRRREQNAHPEQRDEALDVLLRWRFFDSGHPHRPEQQAQRCLRVSHALRVHIRDARQQQAHRLDARAVAGAVQRVPLDVGVLAQRHIGIAARIQEQSQRPHLIVAHRLVHRPSVGCVAMAQQRLH
jgi:hypothetical protein